MKISELPRIENPSRESEIPIAMEGENYNVTLGQIVDSRTHIVRFGGISAGGGDIQYVNTIPPIPSGVVVFDLSRNSFFFAIRHTSVVEGETLTTEVHYKSWVGYDMFYDEDGELRNDCLFIANDGRIYFAYGDTIKSAGISNEQANQIRHASPIEVASEEEMAQRIALGEYEEGQLYFLAES